MMDVPPNIRGVEALNLYKEALPVIIERELLVEKLLTLTQSAMVRSHASFARRCDDLRRKIAALNAKIRHILPLEDAALVG
jgi:hypothetical protein